MIKALLFDLDGTLIDSEPLYRLSNTKFLAGYGISFTEMDWARVTGMGAHNFLKLLHKDFGLVGKDEDLILEMDALYQAEAKKSTKAFPQVVTLARRGLAAGMKLAIASGSTPESIALSVGYAGLSELFPLQVSASQVPQGKPAPDIFIKAAQLCGVHVSEFLVIEDSVLGVQAALAAGMTVLAMPYEPLLSNDPVYQKAQFCTKQSAEYFDSNTFITEAKMQGLWP